MNRIVAHYFKDMSDIPFSAETYSKFKYGCTSSSVKFGIELGKQIEAWAKVNVQLGDTVMITGAPYNVIPVASTALADYVVMYLQQALPAINFSIFKVDRKHSYHVDYGAMSAEEREALIGSDKFSCHTNLSNAHVIFIDDIVITGAHERNMDRMIKELDLTAKCKSINFSYYAMLTDPGCCPTIEADLNYALVKENGSNIVEVLGESVSEHFNEITINTRLTKFLLLLPPDDFEASLFWLESTTLYRYILANNYHNEEQYLTNFNILKRKINESYGFN